MFTLTPTAAEQIASAAREQSDDPGLRIAAKFDEDGEIVYGMGFDAEREDDLVIEAYGVTLLIAPRSQPLLDQARLDFVEVQPGEFQFVFEQAAESCSTGGCGGCGSRGGGCG